MAKTYAEALLSNMVAGNGGVGLAKTGGVPRFDEENYEGWLKFFKAFLMKFDRADLALTEDMPLRVTEDEEVTMFLEDDPLEAEFEKLKNKWLSRNTIAYSYLMEACMYNANASRVVTSYKGTMAQVLLKNLGERFRIIQQSVKQAEISKFNNLLMEQGETCSNFVDRVKEQAFKLENMGERVSNTNLITRLKDGLFKVHSELAHVLYIQASEDLKVVEAAIRAYDNTPMAKHHNDTGVKQVDKANAAGAISGRNGAELTCRYCRKRGHVEKDCWKKDGDKKKKAEKKVKYIPGTQRLCHVCSSPDHIMANCPKNKDKKKGSTQLAKYNVKGSKKRDSTDKSWPTWKPSSNGTSKRKHSGNENSSNSSVDYAMMMKFGNLKRQETLELDLNEELVTVMVDSGANRCNLNRKQYFDVLDENDKRTIQLAMKEVELPVEGVGSIGNFKEVYYTPQAESNLCGVNVICDLGYACTFTKENILIKNESTNCVEAKGFRDNGLYYLHIDDLLSLGGTDVINSAEDRAGIGRLELLHERLGHCAHSTIKEGCRNQLYQGISLPRAYYNKKTTPQLKPCHVCNKVKSTRRSFKKFKKPYANEPGDFISCDMGIFTNQPSRDGFIYTLVFTDHASKYTWLYGLKLKSQALECLQHLVEKRLPQMGIKLKHYHADGAGELIGEEVRTYLDGHGATYSWTPADTPELNGMSERKHRTHNNMTKCMLVRSGLHREFWYDAYRVAQSVTNKTPTKTCKGYMTPHECVFGNAPNMEHFRVWGCKCYVRNPRGSVRADWSDSSKVGFLVGYSDTPIGWIVYIPETGKCVTTVHVTFNEVIPGYREEYFKELDNEMLMEEMKPSDPNDFLYLVGTTHVDMEDGLFYEVTRIAVTNDRHKHVIAYRCPKILGFLRKSQEESIHVRDVEKMVAATLGSYDPRSEGIQSERLDPEGSDTEVSGSVPTSEAGQESKCTTGDSRYRGVRQSKRKRRLVDIPVVRTSNSAVAGNSINSDVGTTGGSNRRVSTRTRFQNRVTNISSLGDIGGDGAKVYQSVCNMFSDTGGGEEEELDPISTYGALNGPWGQDWAASIEAENQALFDRDVFEVVDKPPGVHLLKSRYVHVIKKKLGKVDRRKSRLVALGCGQRAGMDFGETFAPVAKSTSIRLVFAFAQIFSLHMHQMDVDTAFLYAPLQEEIYMKPPIGMDIPPGTCLKLKKSLYGLKQAPTNFNNYIDKFIREMGFSRCVLDNCLYVMDMKYTKLVLAIYVDDIVLVSKDLELITEVKDAFKENFQMKDLGELRNYLGMRITREDDTLKVDQTEYARIVLKRFERLMSTREDKFRKSVPFYRDLKLTKKEKMSPSQRKYAKNFPYQEVVGSVLYLAIHTRPDIAYAVNMLCRFSAYPTYSACRAAVRLLHYIRSTVEYGIQYTGHELVLSGWTDSDWGGDIDTRRSTTGNVVTLAGGPISWISHLQKIVTTSSMEAEYVAGYEVVQEITWTVGVSRELGIEFGPVNVYMDNKSAIALANNPVFHKRSKHIDIKYHWLREKIAEGVIKLVFVRSVDQLADILTKGLAYPRFMELVFIVRGVFVFAVDCDGVADLYDSDSDC